MCGIIGAAREESTSDTPTLRESLCFLLAILDNVVFIVLIFILTFSWGTRNQQNRRISRCVLVAWVPSMYSVEKECIHILDDHISIKL